jgi:hypothetical protein
MNGTPGMVARQKTTTEILDFVQNDDLGRGPNDDLEGPE